jgi:hypothetical protein
MSLPKINTSTFKLDLPSSGKTISYRSFLVKEEKILLMAKEDGSTQAMIDALKQIVTNCVIDDINVNKMPLFDLEYVFLRIRSKSQSDRSELRYTDAEDQIEYDAIFDYNKIRVEKDESHSTIIDLDGNVGVTMRYPTIQDLEKMGMFKGDQSVSFSGSQAMNLIKLCIKSVYDSENDYPMENASEAEKEEFFESLSGEYLNKIKNFFDTFPSVIGEIEYYKDKKIVKKEVKGIQHFL